jgi:hypothetical protein
MTEHTQASATNLTGVWDGIYSYPSRGKSVTFVASLIENGSWLTGSTHEPCVGGNCPADTLYATLAGSRWGSAVTFVKTYDCAGPHFQNPVNYEGTLNQDGTEIEGRWVIRQVLTGRFLMIRSTGKAETVAREKFERV